jgi:D-glycero-D-manno-heptose 1,7-bisphosphate phosphatase
MDKFVFLDRDGTLIEDVGYISDPARIVVKQGVFEGLKLLKNAQFKFVIISNQSGLARKLISEREFEQVSKAFVKLFADQEIYFEVMYYCFHLPTSNCLCRKPGIEFFSKAIAKVEGKFIAAMVGDSIVDALFAQNCDIPFYTTSEISGYQKYTNFESIAQAISAELANVE